MAHQKRHIPELPAEAYQLAEMYHLGQPLKLHRANFTDGLGCILAILGFVVALVPLGGFLYEDYTCGDCTANREPYSFHTRTSLNATSVGFPLSVAATPISPPL